MIDSLRIFERSQWNPGHPGWHALAIVLAVGLSTGRVAPAQSVPTLPPNVILIVTDDQGIGDFGIQGNPVIATPHIDRLARESVSFTDFYVCPVCSPTRACLMTGRYNYRTRCIDTYIGRSMMEPAEVTVAEVLAAAGYQTGIFGKWHLGDCYPMRPIDQGFRQSLVIRGGGLAQPSEPIENQRRYTDPILFRNGQQVQSQGYCTDVYFDAAIEFMRRAHGESRPFFAYIPTNAPHDPVHDVPLDWLDYYQRHTAGLKTIMLDGASERGTDHLARIAAMISNIDDNVGRLMAQLRQLDLEENTLVILMVDNGPNTRRFVGEWRGMKSEVYEGGIRSPLWLHWPGRLPAGAELHTPAAHIDIFPTILAACGVDTNGPSVDGRNLLPLTGPSPPAWPDRSIVIQSHRGDRPTRYHNFMIRQGSWKLVHPSGFGRSDFPGEPKFELYNLQDDPGESHNLASANPERVADLRRAYDQWFDDVSATRDDNYAPPRIVIGSSAEPLTTLTRQDWRAAGWDGSSNGTWLLRNEQAGPFKIQILLGRSPTAQSGSIALQADQVSETRSFAADDEMIEFDHFELPAGEFSLSTTIRQGDQTRGAYQVLMQRQ